MSELLTVAQVASILQVSEDTVLRRFAKEKGVIDLGSPETPRRRRYRLLRIPKTVVEKFLLQRGGPVRVELPAESLRRKKIARSEDAILRDLAELVKQDGTDSKKTLERIARRARTLTFIPKSLWSDVVFIEDEDADD
jgi:hypothetical protein